MSNLIAGYESSSKRVTREIAIGVIDDLTLEEAQRALPEAKSRLTANARGVLIADGAIDTVKLSRASRHQSYTLFYDRRTGEFSCLIWSPTDDAVCFGPENSFYGLKRIDSVLGETTLEGILRVLDIPPHMLPPPTGTSAGPEQGPEQGPEIAHPSADASRRDALWAVAAALPADALQWCKQQLLEDMRERDLEIVSGADGFTAMLAFAQNSEVGDAIALKLSAKYEVMTYSLDFDDEAEYTRQYHVRVQRQNEHPMAFLEARGIAPASRPVKPLSIVDPESDEAVVEEVYRELARELLTTLDLPPEAPIQLAEDPQWAIVIETLTWGPEWCQRQLGWPLCEQGSRVVAGARGFSALLGYGGPEDLWMSIAANFVEQSKSKISTYLLKIDGDDRSVKKLDVRVRRKKLAPAELLEAHGIEAFGRDAPPSEPEPISPIAIGVVDGITLEQAQAAIPHAKELFTANARGVLVRDTLGFTISLCYKLERQAFELSYNRADGHFHCVVLYPGQEPGCFDPGGRHAGYQPIPSILGETTLEGILRVLDIPRHMLEPPLTGSATSDS